MGPKPLSLSDFESEVTHCIAWLTELESFVMYFRSMDLCEGYPLNPTLGVGELPLIWLLGV